MPSIVRFDRFEVELASGELRKNGIRIHLREQSFQALALLLERAGHVVTREDLRRRLWPADVFVDFENNLNNAIAKIREALGDSADRPRFIETLPRRGYRFAAAVSRDEPTPQPRHAAVARVAVLPFVNLTGDPGQEYISDAITEEVITELSALAPQLGVIARTTAMRFKRTQKDVARIGRELDVQYIVEGGICPDGDRIAVTVQLIRVSNQTHLFARRYEADRHNLFETRSDIAEAIIAAISNPMGGGAAPLARSRDRRGTGRPTEVDAAYKEYIQGRQLLERGEPDAMMAGKRFIESAIARDPKFALAHDALADFYSYSGYFGYTRPREAFSIGISHALAAVETSPALAEAHAVLAEYHKQLDYNWPAAEREMARALELDPSSPLVRIRHAVVVLMPHNRVAEAIGEIEDAIKLDPLSVMAQTWLGAMRLLHRENDRAIREGERLLQIAPGSPWPFYVTGYAHLHKYVEALADGERRPDFADRAIGLLRRAIEVSHGSDFFLGCLGHALATCGREAEARAVLEQLRQSGRYNLPTACGFIYLGLGEFDAAFEWLDRAVEDRDQIMMPILSYGHFAPIRDDPRFAALVRKMKLA